jgi:hypothetical protein
MIVRISLIALMVFGVDYAVRCGYMLVELLQDRWYERPPGKYILAAHDPSWMARLVGALVAVNLTFALL